MAKIYAIVVTYNGAKWIDKCFSSLVESNIPLRILAIDNGSEDSTPVEIRQRFPQVEVIETGENLGFGRANNIGLKKVLEEKMDFAFLLNQDAWIEPDTVEKLINVAMNHPEYGILSPVHLNGKGNGLDVRFAGYLNDDTTPGFLSDLYLDKIKNVYSTDFANAASWLITAECLKIVGGFDPLFPHYGEDDDYLNRTIYHGLKIGIVPGVRIYHDRKDSSWNDQKNDVKRLIILNMIALKKYPSPFRSNLLLFFKNYFDKLTSLLLYRKFTDFKFRFIAFWKTLPILAKVRKSKMKYSHKFTKIYSPPKSL